MYEKTFPNKRYKHTILFLQKHISTSESILDLGVKNPFTEIMHDQGYKVENTKGEDLDIDTSSILKSDAKVVTAFEIFEHLLNPYAVLKAVEAKKLIATIPLNLWFAKAYRSTTDMRDRHYHEFEDWQFDWLVEKTGWTIKKTNKWTSPINKIGVRPILRKFTPRYYAIYAEK